MTTTAEIRQLVAAGATEAQRVVFVPSSMLSAPEGLRALAREMVALANRDGGRLVLGVTGSGQFEGRLAVDRQHAAAAVREVAAGMLEPPLDPVLEFLGDEAGEVLVVRVSRRSGRPHAAPGAAAGDGPGVFVRVGDRTRTATAQQVEWMRRVQSDPAFEDSFVLRIPVTGNLPAVADSPPIGAVFSTLLARIPAASMAAVAADRDRRIGAYAELAPWVLLMDLTAMFADDPGAADVPLGDLAVPGRRSAFAAVPGGLAGLLGGSASGNLIGRLLRRRRAAGFRLPTGCEPHVDTFVHQRKGRLMLAHPAWSVTFTAQPEPERAERADGAGEAVLLRIDHAVVLAFPERPEQIPPQADAERIRAVLADRWRPSPR